MSVIDAFLQTAGIVASVGAVPLLIAAYVIGSGNAEERIREANYLISKGERWAEFAQSPDTLSALYTVAQLTKMRAVFGNQYPWYIKDMAAVLDTAIRLREMREALEEQAP